jgi:hypothetical protein
MVAVIESHFGSVYGIKQRLGQDVLRAAPKIKGNTLGQIVDQLPKDGSQVTEFERTAIGKSLTYEDAGLIDLKDRIGAFLNRSENQDLRHVLDQLFQHSEVVILPNPDNSKTASPSIIVNDSYYDDPDTKNHKLVEIASLLANEFNIVNFYLPDVRTKYIKANGNGTGSLSVFGGYKVMKFLDYGNSDFNSKDALRENFEGVNEVSFLLRKITDFGAATLDSNGSSRVTIKYPNYTYLEGLGIHFDTEQDYVDYKAGVGRAIIGPDGEPIVTKSVSKFSPNIKKPSMDVEDSNITDVKTIIANALQPDTPTHIANLILSQDWLWDKKNKEVLLLPTTAEESAYDYKIEDVLNFTRYFTNQSPIYPDMYEASNENHDRVFNKASDRVLKGNKDITFEGPRLAQFPQDD